MYVSEGSLVPYIEMSSSGDIYHCGWECKPVDELQGKIKNTTKSTEQVGGALFEHQAKTLSAALQAGRRGLLIQHSTGTGKTTITLSIAVQLLQLDPTLQVLITAPSKGISAVWKPALASIPPGLQDVNSLGDEEYASLMKRVQLVTHDSLRIDNSGFIQASPLDTKKPFVLFVDESHAFRMSNMKGLGERTSKALLIAARAQKVFLLTATPVFNDPFEAGTLYAMLIGQTDPGKVMGLGKCFTKAVRDGQIDRVSRMWKCLVSYHAVDFTETTLNFPLLVEHPVVNQVMEPDEYTAYRKVQDEPKVTLPTGVSVDRHVFYNGLAQANNVQSKLSWVTEFISDRKVCHIKSREKVIVYSRFPQTSFGKLRRHLERVCPKGTVGQITGETNDSTTRLMVENFNDETVKVLLLSKAGGSSLDLKGTRHVIILEPHFNDAWIRQVIGRAVRNGSHQNLRSTERQVEVYHLLWDAPSGEMLSADRRIHDMSVKKQALITSFYRGLIDASIENDVCSRNQHVIPKWVSNKPDKLGKKKRSATRLNDNTKARKLSRPKELGAPDGYVVDEDEAADAVMLEDDEILSEEIAHGTIEDETPPNAYDYEPEFVLAALDEWFEPTSTKRRRTTAGAYDFEPEFVLAAIDEWFK